MSIVFSPFSPTTLKSWSREKRTLNFLFLADDDFSFAPPGVDDLLNNTHRALGLKLDRDEAASLISMLDVDGDQAIQCNELEVGKT